MDKFIINDYYDDMNYRKEYLLKELKELFVDDEFEVNAMSNWNGITPRQRVNLLESLEIIFDFNNKMICLEKYHSELSILKKEHTNKNIDDHEFFNKHKEIRYKYNITDNNAYNFPNACYNNCEKKIKELCKENKFDVMEIYIIIEKYLEKKGK